MEIIELMERVLNLRALYHRVIAGNIANVETPNYKERYVDFKEALRGIERDGRPQIKERLEGGRPDGNTVQMERQVSELTENSLHFYALLSSLTKKFSLMRYVIGEGRR
jgi:flagellar basal-body rod protein FlgB